MESYSRIETLAEILLETRRGATRMKIMDEGELTSSQLEQYLCFLQQSDLLRMEEGSGVFIPTKKGTSLIGEYERINQMID